MDAEVFACTNFSRTQKNNYAILCARIALLHPLEFFGLYPMHDVFPSLFALHDYFCSPPHAITFLMPG